MSDLAGVEQGLHNDCTNQDSSTATVSQGESAATSIVGKVGSLGDTANTNDVDGVAYYENVEDWTSFDRKSRYWGLDGLLDFPDGG